MEPTAATTPALPRLARGDPRRVPDPRAPDQRPARSPISTTAPPRRSRSPCSRRSIATGASITPTSTAASTRSRRRRQPLYEGARDRRSPRIWAPTAARSIFVRNATEAINLVASRGASERREPATAIVLTEMEHHSNIVPWYQLAERGAPSSTGSPITDEGRLDLDAFANAARARPEARERSPTSPTCSAPSTPSAEIARIAHDAGALLLVDGAQAGPKLALDMAAARRRLLRAHRPQGVRADRDRRPVRAARAARRDAAVHRRRLDDPEGHEAS